MAGYRIPNTDVLERAGLPTIFTLLSQRHFRWLGHVHRMEDSRTPKDLLYWEFSGCSIPQISPRLRIKDSCIRDMKRAEIDKQSWESLGVLGTPGEPLCREAPSKLSKTSSTA
jgi:transcription termination factor 2